MSKGFGVGDVVNRDKVEFSLIASSHAARYGQYGRIPDPYFYSYRFPDPKKKDFLYTFSSALHSQGKSSSRKTVIRSGFAPVN